MTAKVDMIGVRVGRLIGLAEESRGFWLFQCDCGQTKVISGRAVRSGNTSSCGCLHSEICADGARERFTVHGLYGTPIHTKWRNMWARVGGEENYVGRIFVCDRWKDVQNFLEDMGEPPPGMTLERIDNDGNYEPGNCKWATTAEQNINRGGCGIYKRSVLRYQENNNVILNVEGFWEYLIERESIRLRRLAGLPSGEWSTDWIFQQFSFTNCKRIHDRTTTLLRQEFYDLHQSDNDKIILLNAAIFRYFGCIETARIIGWSSDWNQTRRDFIQMRGLCDELRFTPAYIIPSCGRSEPKYEVVLDIIEQMWGRFDELLKYNSWEQWTDVLSSSYGCGQFMAKEILLDYIMATKRNPVDWETWTPVGPGGRLGAGWVRDNELTRLSSYESLEVIRSIYETRDEFWPENFVKLELTDIQFAFCEVAKYQKAFTGVGRPKRNFRPTVDDVTRKIADSSAESGG